MWPVRCRLCWFYTPPSASTCSRTQKIDFIDWLVGFRDKHSLASRDLTKNFSVPKKCTNKFDYLLYEMFLFKNRDLLSMCSRTQFVQGILIRFLIFFYFHFGFQLASNYFFSLYVLIVRLHFQKIFYFLHAYIFSSRNSYYSLENDRSLIESFYLSFLSKILRNRYWSV